MTATPPLHGVYTPHLVPLDDRGEINEGELRRYLDWLIARRVHGLFANGTTGEFTRFTPDEHRRIVRTACEQAAGRVPVIAGAAESTVKETLAACEAYAGFGARAVAVVPPYYFRLGPESVYAYFREIAAHAPLDVILYHIPSLASPIDLATVRRLAELPRVIGIKDSSGDAAAMMRLMVTMRRDRPQFALFNGSDALMAPMFLMGVDGGVHGTSGLAPEAARQIYDLCRRGHADHAREIQLGLTGLLDAMEAAGDFLESLRTAVALRGFHFGRGRQPMTDSQRARIEAGMDAIRHRLHELGEAMR